MLDRMQLLICVASDLPKRKDIIVLTIYLTIFHHLVWIKVVISSAVKT